MESQQGNSRSLSPRNMLYSKISDSLDKEDVKRLHALLVGEKIPKGKLEEKTPHEIFNMLEEDHRIGEGNLGLLIGLLKRLGKTQLAMEAEKLERDECKAISKRKAPEEASSTKQPKMSHIDEDSIDSASSAESGIGCSASASPPQDTEMPDYESQSGRSLMTSAEGAKFESVGDLRKQINHLRTQINTLDSEKQTKEVSKACQELVSLLKCLDEERKGELNMDIALHGGEVQINNFKEKCETGTLHQQIGKEVKQIMQSSHDVDNVEPHVSIESNSKSGRRATIKVTAEDVQLADGCKLDEESAVRKLFRYLADDDPDKLNPILDYLNSFRVQVADIRVGSIDFHCLCLTPESAVCLQQEYDSKKLQAQVQRVISSLSAILTEFGIRSISLAVDLKFADEVSNATGGTLQNHMYGSSDCGQECLYYTLPAEVTEIKRSATHNKSQVCQATDTRRMTEKTGLPVEEEVDKMRFGKLIRLLRELDMIELNEKEARTELKRRFSYREATTRQAAENLRQILGLHNTKRERLAELCHRIAAYLPRLDRSIKDKLKTQFDRTAEDILTDVQTQLHKEECPILVAGETSSGKSAFLNLLLGENILPVAHQSSTSTICEVKYGEKKKAVVHLRNPSHQITIPLDGPDDNKQQKKLKGYIHVEGTSRDSHNVGCIEIFWPLPLLKGGIVLVDSPGVGESEMMDRVVADYIPKVSAFLYIIDSSRAWGVQQDRLGRLLQLHANKENAEDFNPESAMFICNKWDLVPLQEQEEVKSETLRKLKQMWTGLEESQVFFVSTRKAVRLGGILSEDFSKVLDGLDLLLPKSLDIKLETQYRLLTQLLTAALAYINAKLNVSYQNLSDGAKLKKYQEANGHFQSFKEKATQSLAELESILRENVETTKELLSGLLKDGNLKNDLMAVEKLPVMVSWMIPRNKKVKHQDVLVKLVHERKGQDFSKLEELYEALADTLGHCPSFERSVPSVDMLNYFKCKLKAVVNSLEKAQQQAMSSVTGSSYKVPHMDVMQEILFKTSIRDAMYATFFRGLTMSSLHWPGRWSKRIAHLQLWEVQFSSKSKLRSHWDQAHRSSPLVDVLISALSSSEELLTELAERQMQPQRNLMDLLEVDITKITKIMDQTIDQTFKDARSNEAMKQTYEPQSRDINRFLGQLAVFHLTSTRRYEYELDSITGWKDTDNRIGGGSFGEVYRVQVPWKGAETQEAALKIGVTPYTMLTTDTAWEFLQEEENLRKLKGDHIVEYYGTACRREGGGLRLGLVMELCEGTLADRIIGQSDHNPARCKRKSEKQAAAFSYTQNLAVQLCEGLKHIHDAGYMHRDLKLINVLVNKDNVVKLADFGQTKREVKITGTAAGTLLYAAPEVKEGKIYDKSADIYSLGLILWEMWYGTALYEMEKKVLGDIHSTMVVEDLKRGKDIRMPKWPGTVPPIPEWTRLIHNCLKMDPRKRPEIQDCLDRMKATSISCHMNFKKDSGIAADESYSTLSSIPTDSIAESQQRDDGERLSGNERDSGATALVQRDQPGKLLELQKQVTDTSDSHPNLNFIPEENKEADERIELNRKTLQEEDFSSDVNLSLDSVIFHLIQERMNSVCRINWPGGAATGFLLSKGKVLTCNHVYKMMNKASCRESRSFPQASHYCNTATFFVSVGSKYEVPFEAPAAMCICYSEDLDYAILQLAVSSEMERNLDSLPFLGQCISESTDCRKMFVVVGHPNGGNKVVDFGLIDEERLHNVRKRCPDLIPDDKRKVYYDTSVMFHGSSGSPGFDTQGDVAFMHTRGLYPDNSSKSVVESGTRLTAIRDDAHQKLAPEVCSEIFPDPPMSIG